jgi:hypothetical protein
MAKRKTSQNRTTAALSPGRSMVPSAPTLFRLHLREPALRDALGAAFQQASPETLVLYQETIDRIDAAATVEQLLDLASDASGLSAPVWHRRIASFSPEITPLISERLRRVRDLPDKSTQSTIVEQLLAALALFGDAGIQALHACYQDLNDYAKSLACVVLGQLGAHEHADLVWDTYQELKSDLSGSAFIGPLWGLVDLADPRAADALDELLWDDQYFYECFAMVYRAGDSRALLPLMHLFLEGGETLKDPAAWALVGLAHRVGRQPLLGQLRPAVQGAAIPLAEREAVIDLLLRLPNEGADAYFTVFFGNVTRDMIGLDNLTAEPEIVDPVSPSDHAPPPPARRPGRNDPCWCNSGKKYKHCHWRRDRREAR